jgi:naphthalene 1,2-dioxygenase ferredoxin component
MTTPVHATWHPVARLDDLWEDNVLAFDVAGREIALYRLGDAVFATDNGCTHGHARLCDGFVENGEIECPLHQGRFDIRTGKAMCRPLTEDLRTYPVRIEDGQVQVSVGDAG